jgi:glycoside/pentoside/hexuronide:cation symporter, GPH family
MSTTRLRTGTKLAFGVGSAAEAAITIAFNTFNFIFYNNVLGLSGTLCGLAVTIAMVGDALCDPLIGSLSDRMRSRFGRRHPFLYAAPIPLAIAFYLLYAPPVGLEGWGLFAWFTVFALLQRGAMALYHGPHLALGAELSTDYRERSVVMSYNIVFHVVGGSLAFFFGWTWFARFEGGTATRAAYAPMAAAVGLFAALVIFASAFMTRDQIPRLPKAPLATTPFSLKQLLVEIRGCLQNRNFVAIALGSLLLSATTGTRETLASYSSLFYWELPEKGIRIFGLASPPAFVLAFFLTVRLHARFDKRAAIVGSAIVLAAATALPVPLNMLGLLPTGAQALTATLFGFVFLFYGALAVLSISVLSALADIADEHELTTGQRQEGMFFAARSLFAKASSGLGHVLGGAAIDLIDFPKGALPGQVPKDVIFQLGLVDGPISSLPAVLAVIIFARYALNRQKHESVQRQLHTRRAAPSTAKAVEAVIPPAITEAV